MWVDCHESFYVLGEALDPGRSPEVAGIEVGYPETKPGTGRKVSSGCAADQRQVQ